MKWYNPFTWVPWTVDGRSTMMYLVFAGSGPAIMLVLLYAMRTIRNWVAVPALNRLEKFAEIADKLAWGMLIVLVTLACFISIRAFKFNAKTGTLDVNSSGGDDQTQDEPQQGDDAGNN